jgi:hypothetical protein
VTRRTPVSPAKLTILERTLDLALLDEAGADVIILHKTYDYDGTLGTVARERLGTPFYQDERIAIWDAPEASSAAVFTTILPPEGQIAGVSDSYFYVPEGESGWLRFQVHLTGEAVVSFKLNGEVMDEPIISGDTRIILDFPITTPGYHTITLDFHSLCPALYPPELTCRYFTSEDYGADFMPSMENQVNFGRGVRLGGARFDRLDSLRQLSLWWQFDQPMTDQDIRFVKVLDEGGNQAAGFDSTLGAVPAGAQRLETLNLDLASDLPPGIYRVYVGWYSYPDLVRFPVLSDVPGAQDGWAMIGEFTIPAE